MAERPDATPPFYFRRVWTGVGTDADEIDVHRVLADGTYLMQLGLTAADLGEALRLGEIVSIAPEGLVIYGRRVAPLAEDAKIVAAWEKSGRVYAECFSVQCLDGEVGTHPRSEVEQISREEFEAARERGWESESA